ncbi:hypothetical protein JX266_014528, partial [Neoarthrinium moseri]
VVKQTDELAVVERAAYLLLFDTHIPQNPLDDLHVKRRGSVTKGHELEHALRVEELLIEAELLNFDVIETFVRFLVKG